MDIYPVARRIAKARKQKTLDEELRETDEHRQSTNSDEELREMDELRQSTHSGNFPNSPDCLSDVELRHMDKLRQSTNSVALRVAKARRRKTFDVHRVAKARRLKTVDEELRQMDKVRQSTKSVARRVAKARRKKTFVARRIAIARMQNTLAALRVAKAREQKTLDELCSAQVRSLKSLDIENREIDEHSQSTNSDDVYDANVWRMNTLDEENQKIDERSQSSNSDKSWLYCTILDKGVALETATKLLDSKHYPGKEIVDELSVSFGRKSLLVSSVSERICKYIEEFSEDILHVWAAYRMQEKNKIHYVVVMKDGKQLPRKKINYDFVERNAHEFSPEAEAISKDMSNLKLDSSDTTCIEKAINVHAETLLKTHRYLSIVSASPIRSTGYRTNNILNVRKELCIVLYVHTKNSIPLAEEPFRESYGGIPVDVREGEFLPCMNKETPLRNPERVDGGENPLRELRMGDRIGYSNLQDTDFGTLGGFVEHPHYGLCGITCAHVLLKNKKIIRERGGKIEWPYVPDINVFQHGTPTNEIGKLVTAHYKKGTTNYKGHGLDVCLFQIENRYSLSGKFTSLNTTGQSAEEYNSGKTWGYSRLPLAKTAIKYGATTGRTTGEFTCPKPIAYVRTLPYQEEMVASYKVLQVQAENRKFADKGDSGSLVFVKDESNDDELVCVGMVLGIGKGPGTCFVTSIETILSALQLSSLKQFKVESMGREIKSLITNIQKELKTLNSKTDNLQTSFDKFLEGNVSQEMQSTKL